MLTEYSAEVTQKPELSKLFIDTDDNWSHIHDTKEKKRIQNRLAQRAYRDRVKQRLQRLKSIDKKLSSLTWDADILRDGLCQTSNTSPSPTAEIIGADLDNRKECDKLRRPRSNVHSPSDLQDSIKTLSTLRDTGFAHDNTSIHNSNHSIQSENSQLHTPSLNSSSGGSGSGPSISSSPSPSNIPALIDRLGFEFKCGDLSTSQDASQTTPFPSIWDINANQDDLQGIVPPSVDSFTPTTNTWLEGYLSSLDSMPINTLSSTKIGPASPYIDQKLVDIPNSCEWRQTDLYMHLDTMPDRHDPTSVSSTRERDIKQGHPQINQQILENIEVSGVMRTIESTLSIPSSHSENGNSSRDTNIPLYPSNFTQSYNRLTTIISATKYFNTEEKAAILEQLIQLSYIIITL